MRKRLLYGSGVALLALLVTLLVWQASFNFGEYAPADLSQTFVFWAVSTLVFVLTVTLGFILFRTGIKLYIERRSHREGSRIKTKLFFGALALSFMPVCFLVFYSYAVLNRNLDKWFARPGAQMRLDYISIGEALKEQLTRKLEAQADVLAAQPEIRALIERGVVSPGFLERFCQERKLLRAEVRRDGRVLDRWGPPADGSERGVVAVDRDQIAVAARVPLDIAKTERQILSYLREGDQLADQRKSVRNFYILMQALIALFTLFATTWIALFLAKQISVPISALLKAADEVGEGNLSYRVEVGAIDELAGLVRGFNEMTAQLEANSRELDARRRFTEAILESIPTGVLSVSAEGLILRVNRALKGLFSEEQAGRARRLEDLFSREDSAEIKYLMKRARRTGAASREMEISRGRQTLHVSVTVSALEEKLTSGFVIVLEDLTDLLHAQKAAAWQEVARRVAHEIKNPLTPIALSAERIGRQLERLDLPADVRRIVAECTSTIGSEVESVKMLADEFAQLARFPAAQPSRADLNDVVESALAVFQGRLDGIRIVTQLAPGLPAVNVDREQFKRVVVNLVDNAAEAMLESPLKEICISTRNGSADIVELVVADTGCGVTPEEKEKLFLPYFSTKGRGTGLGLAIVNHILADHEAKIRVEDNLPAGTRFTIELPAIVESAEETRMAATPAPSPVAAARS